MWGFGFRYIEKSDPKCGNAGSCVLPKIVPKGPLMLYGLSFNSGSDKQIQKGDEIMMTLSTALVVIVSQGIPAELDGRGYFGEICAVCRTSYSGLAIAGYAWSLESGRTEILVMRLDPTGELLWARTIRGTRNSRACAIVQTPDDGLAVAGVTGDFGSHGLLVFKLDPSGELVWARSFRGTGREYACSIALARGDGLTVTGYIWDFETESVQALVFTLDKDGNRTDEGNGMGGIVSTTIFTYGLVDCALSVSDPGPSLRTFIRPAMFLGED